MSHSEWNDEQLREACASIEDYFSGASTSEPSYWCMLVIKPGTRTVYTIRDALSESAGPQIDLGGDPSTKVGSDPINHQMCKSAIEDLLLDGDLVDGSASPLHSSEWGIDGLTTTILRAFKQRINRFEEDSNFIAAHSWFRKLRSFHALVTKGSSPFNVLDELDNIRQHRQCSLDQASRLMDRCDNWLRTVRPYFEKYNSELLTRAEIADRLRDKMWYVADVRTSAAYDEVRSVASALKIMGKPKKPARTRLAPPLRHWSGPKMSNISLHLKTEAQVLEILSAPPDHGGPNKLSDDQSRALSTWMERNAVPNLCRGEERLHKLCMESRKAVDQLTADGSTLLSSALFARDKRPSPQQAAPVPATTFSFSNGGAARFDLLTLRTNVPPSIDSMSSTSSHPLSARSSRDYLESRSPTLTNRSSAPFWSPVMTEDQSPSSATSMGSSRTHAAQGAPIRSQRFAAKDSNESRTEQLRHRTTSLLLSDVAGPLFSDGSETDRAFWTGLGGELSEKHIRSVRLSVEMETEISEAFWDGQFDFDSAFEKLAARFSASCNPFVKLAYLLDIDTLLGPYISQRPSTTPNSRPELRPRTFSLQQLNRQGTSSTVDVKIEGFRRLFCNSSLRPAWIFRDLQYIAALVPSSTLESTAQGKAFWNATVALSGLKQEIRRIMVETADGIIAYHSNNRGHYRASSAAQQERDSATFSAPSRTPSAEDISQYEIADAAYFLQITAKEGDSVAQRELATLYLTHPELMDHIIAPFSRPRDVFKEELESKWRKNQDPNRCDPGTMCVAHHWMSLSSRGGDALAKEYLRQREEMDRLG